MPDDVLVIGYGNTLRGDDGIGPAVAEAVAGLGLPGVRILVVHQLTPELAAVLADVRLAVFVDAGLGGDPLTATPLTADAAGPVMTHAADPRGLLALARAVYGRAPEAWLVTATGTDFWFGDGLSVAGREHVRAACAWVERLLRDRSDG
jgi:hydrogenase maturation protease